MPKDIYEIYSEPSPSKGEQPVAAGGKGRGLNCIVGCTII